MHIRASANAPINAISTKQRSLPSPSQPEQGSAPHTHAKQQPKHRKGSPTSNIPSSQASEAPSAEFSTVKLARGGVPPLSKAATLSLTQPVTPKVRRTTHSPSLATRTPAPQLPTSDDLVYLRPSASMQHQGAGWLQHNKPGTFTFSTEYMAQMRMLDNIWKRNTHPSRQSPQQQGKTGPSTTHSADSGNSASPSQAAASQQQRSSGNGRNSSTPPGPSSPTGQAPALTSSSHHAPPLPQESVLKGEYTWVSSSTTNITNDNIAPPPCPPPAGMSPEKAAQWQDKARWLQVQTRRSTKPSTRHRKPSPSPTTTTVTTHAPSSSYDSPLPRAINTSLSAAQKIQELTPSTPATAVALGTPHGRVGRYAYSGRTDTTRVQHLRQSAQLREHQPARETSEEGEEFTEDMDPDVVSEMLAGSFLSGRSGAGLGHNSRYRYSFKQVVMIRDIFEASGLEAEQASVKLRALVPLASLALVSDLGLLEITRARGLGCVGAGTQCWWVTWAVLTKQVVLNMGLLALAKARVDQNTWKSIQNLLNVMMNQGCMNQHSYGSAVTAFRLVHRFDLALDLFEETCRWAGEDFGPVGSSNLLRCCASDRNLTLAMTLFDRMVQCNVTLNKYSYNSLLHLCASMSHMESAQTVLTLMRGDSRPGNTPDSYTYSAMLRALSNCKQWDMLVPLYEGMVKRGLEADIEVWCQLITAASYAGRLELSCKFFADMKAQGIHPNLYIYNAMIAALGRCDGTIDQAMGLYKEMLSFGVCVDHYTYNGLLTTMGHKHASLAQVEDLVREMSRHGVRLNTFVGTSLIHAYRHVPELTYAGPEMKAMLISSVDRVLSYLRRERMANGQVFTAVMALHAQMGDSITVKALMKDMVESGIPATRFTYQVVGRAFEDAGESYFSEQCKAKMHQMVQAERVLAREERGLHGGGRSGKPISKAERIAMDAEHGLGVGARGPVQAPWCALWLQPGTGAGVAVGRRYVAMNACC
ncbi:MAG: hypothetical protein WDW38_004186 [Sanguina aurantia]